ncbi:MAG: MFS transporter, partial [Pseudonocardiaceae bacterium]
RTALLAVAILRGLDGLEEYTPLLAQEWGVPTGLVPLAALSVPLTGAVGAVLGGAASGLRPSALTAVLGVGVLALGAAGFLRHPVGLVGVALFYGLLRLVLVVVDARLQERIEGSARATVTSVAGLGGEIAAFALFAAWALGEVMVVTALALVATAALPRLLRIRAAV